MYAIIGIGCRFAGKTNDPESFYDVLYNKKDTLEEIPKDRWNINYFHHPDKTHPGTMVHKRGGFLDPYFSFDNEAFQMSIKEAKSLDPSTKILLEVALDTFQDANVKYRGTRTGCFIGTGQQGFGCYTNKSTEFTTQYSATGCNIGIQANMISYKFDLRGPSMAIDTACSSAASALYTAINSFNSGDIDYALIGGLNHLLDYGMSVCFSRLGVLSPDGKCKSFDKDANGYVRSEGCGMILIKPFEKAVEDNDHIYCVIKSVYANEDGALEPSLTKPSSKAQERLIRKTLKRANVSPEDVFYVECHATGTQVGDPAECKCIGRICSENRDDLLRVGSVKTNIGHCEMASFLASVIKCCLMCDRKMLLPTILNEINPKLEMEKNKMKVQTEVESFDPDGKIFVVNSFGFGGANACCVLEGYSNPENDEKKVISAPYLYVLSGRTESAIKARIEQIKDFSKKFPDQYRLSYSLNTQVRESTKLITYGIGNNCHESVFSAPMRVPDEVPHMIFVFSGQGPQNIQMGRNLYKKFPVFRKYIDECDRIFKGFAGYSILYDIGLFGDKVCKPEELKRIDITLAGLLFIQVGLYELLKSFGLSPDTILGHSFGEMISFYANGSCSLRDVINVAFARGKICETLQNAGKMLAVGVGAKEITKIIDENEIRSVWVAADNSPVSCTVGGIHESIDKLDKICEDKKIFHRVLTIPNAFHTPLLNPMKEAAQKLFPVINNYTPKVPLVSTVTGDFYSDSFTKSYMWKNISQGVKFRGAMELLLEKYGKDTVFVEIAPQPVLSLSMKQSGAKNTVFTLQKNTNEQKSMLSACGKLIGFGYDIDWPAIMGDNNRIVNIPRYPFQRNDCFLNVEDVDTERFVTDLKSSLMNELPGPLLGRKQNVSSEIWTNKVNTKKYPWLIDHVVQNSVIFPAAGFIELFLELKTKSLSNIQIHNPLLVGTEDNKYSIVETSRDSENNLRVCSRKQGSQEWTLNATCSSSLNSTENQPKVSFSSIFCQKKKTEKKEIYEKLQLKDLQYGKYFQLLDEIYEGDDEVVMVINSECLNELPLSKRYVMHPSIVDATFQGLELITGGLKTFLPTSIQSIKIYNVNEDENKNENLREKEVDSDDENDECFKENEENNLIFTKLQKNLTYCHCILTERTEDTIVGDLFLFDYKGRLMLEIIGLKNKYAKKTRNLPKLHYSVLWQKKKLVDLQLNKVIKVNEGNNSKYIEFEKKLCDLKRKVLCDIQKGLNRLKGLSVPKEKHDFLNWILSVSDKMKLKSKTDVCLGEEFNCEKLLVQNVTKFFPLILRNKQNTNQKERSLLIDEFYRKSLTFSDVNSNLEQVFNQISKVEKRVIRILEISSNFSSFASMFLPILANSQLNGKIEVFLSSKDQKFSDLIKDYSFVDVKKIDLNENLSSQGFLNNSIDVILCSGISFSEKLISNLKDILVSSGILLLVQPKKNLNFIFNYIFGSIGKFWNENGTKFTNLGVTELQEVFKKLKMKATVTELCGNYLVSAIGEKQLTNGNGSPRDNCDIFDKPSSLDLLDYVQQHKKDKPLLIITRNVYSVNGVHEKSLLVADYSSNIGFFRVISNEYPKWNVKLVDFSTKMSIMEEKSWIHKITNDFEKFEKEFCIKNNQIYVPRLFKVNEEEINEEKQELKDLPFRLNIDKPGILNSLNFHYFEKQQNLNDNEVYCRVKSASVNFKDLMLAQNMLGDFEKDLGLEFSGVVLEVGSKVTKFKPGDEVFGFADNSLASHVKTSDLLITKKPKSISFEEACSIPTIFITPFYALVKKSQIKEGDKVLIHSAAGGVGQAAIQICKKFKAIPICTCGTEKKRNFLRQKYSCNIFGDSHSNCWDKEIKEQLESNSKGVDVVLNSLAKDNIERGLNMLSPFGSFIEIGKRDILNNSHIKLLPFLENLSYFSVHLDKMISSRKDIVGCLLAEIKDFYENNKMKSIVDKVFNYSKIIEAFRFMQSGKHKGKIIINFDDDSDEVKKIVKKKIGVFSELKTYVLSGGLGTIGFLICHWMIEKEGAKNVVLLSRSGRTTKHQRNVIKKLENEFGARILISKTDVSSINQVKQCYEQIKVEKLPKIGGIIHLAMVLRDARIEIQTKKMFLESFAPKVIGARNLIDSCENSKDLEFVLFFSSISSIIGNVEQSNYSASNSYLDNYAFNLQKRGINAKVINLGAVVDVGVIAENVKLRKIMEQGLLDISNGMKMENVLDSIKRLIVDKKNVQYIPELNLSKVVKTFPQIALKFSHLVEKVESDGKKNGSKNVLTESDVIGVIANLLSIDPKKINSQEKLTYYGIDSLSAVELSMTLKNKFNAAVSQMQILGGLTVEELIQTNAV